MGISNSYLWFLAGCLLFILIVGFLIRDKEKNNSEKTTFKKPLYLPLGIITALLLTPSLAYLLTLNASDFEGANGYAFIYIMPFVFMGLLFLWFLFHRRLSKKELFYKTFNTVFSVISLLLILLYIGLNIKAKNERKRWNRNRSECHKKFEDTYTGIVIDTARGSLKVRKMDTTYQEIKYYFDDKSLMRKHFYVGQKITKKATNEKIEVILKNGDSKEFTIPCYD